MREDKGKNPFMDYRNAVPFMDLSGFIVKRPSAAGEIPAKTLQEYLRRKKFPVIVNLRRLQYCKSAEEYRNGRR